MGAVVPGAGDGWVEALTVGTGRLGAMVVGGSASERLQLNEDTFYAGGLYDPPHEEALSAQDEVRELIWAGRHEGRRRSRTSG